MTELEALRTEIDELRYELEQQAKKTATLEEAVKHLAKNVGSSPASAGAFVHDVLLAP
jgi:septal ring factor EnvC (AmiA/AmiB activator)